MNFVFGKSSRQKLETVHPDLKQVAHKALRLTPIDFTIVWGWRDEDKQNELVMLGASKTPWPESKHNNMIDGNPASLALDFAPWRGEIDWNDTHAFAIIAGVFFSTASICNVKLRYGGDWDMDGSTTDQTFMDWGHVELCE